MKKTHAGETEEEQIPKRQKVSDDGPNEMIHVLPCPLFKPDWVPPGITTSMRPVTDPMVKEFLSAIKMPLNRTTIRFNDIPEYESKFEMIGRVRFLVAKKRKRDDKGNFNQVLSVLPNVLISEFKKFFYWAPNKEWFNLCPGKGGEKRRFDYHIPAPFSDRQNINTACAMNFA